MTTSAMKSAISGVMALGAGESASMDTNRFFKANLKRYNHCFITEMNCFDTDVGKALGTKWLFHNGALSESCIEGGVGR